MVKAIKKLTGMAYNFELQWDGFHCRENKSLNEKAQAYCESIWMSTFFKGKQNVPTVYLNTTKYSECKQVFYPRFFPQLFYHLDMNRSPVQCILLLGGHEAYRYTGKMFWPYQKEVFWRSYKLHSLHTIIRRVTLPESIYFNSYFFLNCSWFP